MNARDGGRYEILHPASTLLDDRALSRQKYVSGLVVSWTRDPDISPTLPPKFYTCPKVRNLVSICDRSPLCGAVALKRTNKHLKLKTCTVVYDWSVCTELDNSPVAPLISTGNQKCEIWHQFLTQFSLLSRRSNVRSGAEKNHKVWCIVISVCNRLQ